MPTGPLLLLQRVEDVVVLVELAERRRRKRRRRLLPLLLRLRTRATREYGERR